MSTPPNIDNPPENPSLPTVDPKNPLDFPRYIRSLRPSLPESLPFYVDDELDKVSQSLQALEQAASNDATAKVQEERITRITEDEALAARIVTVAAEFDAANAETQAMIRTEEIARASADEALASRVDELSAELDTVESDIRASITEESLARATELEAIAGRITTVDTTYEWLDRKTNARISDEIVTRVSADEALAIQITTVEATLEAADTALNAAIIDEATARVTADSALATDISTVTATANSKNKTFLQPSSPTATATGDIWLDTDDNNKMYRWSGTAWVAVDDGRIAANAAAITTEASARASADSALSSSVTTLSTTVSGHTSTLSTYGTSINGLQAKYGVKLDVNGYITGFEQNNSGTSGDFIVKADTFKVISPGNPNVVPFTVTGSGVQIQGSLLVSSSVGTTAVAGNAITSTASAFSTSLQTVTSLTTWTSVQSVTFTATGQPVMIDLGLLALGATDTLYQMRLTRNGTAIWTGSSYLVALTAWSNGTSTFTIADTPSSGSVTYALEIKPATDSMYCYERYLNVLETKR